MVAGRYYQEVPQSSEQVDLAEYSRPPISSPTSKEVKPGSPIKPLFLAQAHPNTGYANLPMDAALDDLEKVTRQDDDLKRRIRRLRIITRSLSFLLAIAAFIPLVITLHKFLTTRDVHRQVGPISRTAWSLKTKAWPTYMYFAISLFGVIVNLFVLVSYVWGIKAANKVARLGTAFTITTLLLDIAVWIMAVVVYRYERERTENGKHNDLWGWTCSPAAQNIQKVFASEVPFNRYCNIQTAGWAAGLLEVGVLGTSLIVYALMVRRGQSKKLVRRSTANTMAESIGRNG